MKIVTILSFLGKPLKLRTGNVYYEKEISEAASKFESQFTSVGWIKCTPETMPLADEEVMIVLDYLPWGKDQRRIVIARTHFTKDPQHYGGPNALTGDGYLTGIFFSIPAICNPEAVTHWKPIDKLPLR